MWEGWRVQTNAPSPVAPSATTPAAASPAATAAPAPSAPAPLTSVKDAVERAIATARASEPQAPTPVEPQATPAETAQESPAVDAASASPETVPATEPETSPESPETEPAAELSEEETGADPEKLLSALRKERALRKELKQQLKEAKAGTPEVQALQTRLAELEAKLSTKAEPQPAPVNVPVTPPPTLADCESIEAVNARVMLAAEAESLATNLRLALAKNDVPSVVQRLEAEGFKTVAGVPVAEASEQQLDALLSTLYANARRTIAGAEVRKTQLVQQGASAGRAMELIPELKDAKSDATKQFWAIAEQNPWLKQAGPNWPEVIATQMLGLRAKAAKAATRPAAAPAPKEPIVPKRATPGAPKTSTAALPPTNEIEALRAKQKAGTATMEDMLRLQRLQTA